MSKSVTFYAMSQKGYEVIRFVVQNYRPLVKRVVIGRDKSVVKDYSNDIMSTCLEYEIPFSFREDDLIINTDYIIAVSWRWLINAPEKRLIVLHDSPLPKYRGFSPLANCLINGEKQIGVTAIFANSGYDKGDIIAQKTSHISYPITIQQAIETNNANYIDVINGLLTSLQNGATLIGKPQDESEATYSIWRDDEDYRIDWSLSAQSIRRMIDAVGYPYCGAHTFDEGLKVTIDSAEEVDDVKCELRHVGKIIFVDNGMPVIICGQGLLKLTSARFLNIHGNWESYLPIKKFRVRFK